jgi:hypothetical protein
MICLFWPFNIQIKVEVKMDILELHPGRTPSSTDMASYRHQGLSRAREECKRHECP